MIICGDCLVEMAKVEANSIDAIVTDPPYGLEFMGKEWDRLSGGFSDGKFKGFVLPKTSGGNRNVKCPDCGKWIYDHPPRNCLCGGVERLKKREMQQWHFNWAVEALRVAKPGGHLLAFGGTRTFHRLTCAIEDAGWEIRDCLGWLYGSGFPKSHNLKGEHEGWGTALKPAWEPIILARKPLDGTVAANVQKWGTGAINVDGCRVGAHTRANPEAGFIRRGRADAEVFGGTDKNKPDNPPHSVQGRWPANLIHDGSDEVLELFPQTGPGMFPPKRGNGQIFGKSYGADQPTHKTDSGSAARFFYVAKASRKEREMGCEGMPLAPSGSLEGGNDKRNGKDKPQLKPAANHHPTVKPLALMRYLCRLVTPPNGLILDPFMGSGTTGIAAKQEGFRFVGIEVSEEYCEIAKKRIYGTLGGQDALHSHY